MKLVGAVSDVPGRALELGQRLAQDTVKGPQAIIDLLHSGTRTALFSIRRPEETRDDLIIGTSANGRDRFWFSGDYIETHDRPAPAVADVEKAIERLHADLEGGFVGVRIDSVENLTIWSDTWGLVPTFARQLSDASVFASDFEAVCRAGDQPRTRDRDCVLLELAIGFSPDHRTVFAEVVVIDPGSVIQIDPTGPKSLCKRSVSYADKWFGASRKSKFESLDGHFERMGQRVARHAGGHAAISLSAGYDSRYALAVLSRAEAVGPLFTFGEPDSDEVVEAHAVAARHADRPDWELFRIPETSWTAWKEMIQSLGNAGIVQWCGWADDWLSFVRQHARGCVIGYLGDALSGKRLDQMLLEDQLASEIDPEIDLWTRRWVAFELDMGEWAQSPLLRPHARRDLLRIAAERFDALAADVSFAGGFQRAFHCNLMGRQRRWVATQPVLMGTYVTPHTFFADKAYRDFWMNIGLDDLLGQSLYLRYAEARFPRFFPKPPGVARALATRVYGKMRREFAAALGRTPALRRPPPIVRTRLLRPHFAQIRETIENGGSWLDDIVDVAAFRDAVDAHASGGSDPRLTTGMLFRCINVMHLLALSARETVDAP